MVPEMDGFTFLEKMHENRAYWSIPVIVMTAKELTGEDRACLNEHVEDILQKGYYQREELLDAVSERVERVTS
jgi:CheY-like chemotaxis protein